MAPADTQICAVHTGVARSPVIPPDGEIDEIAILKKLAKDSNPTVRLRAVDLLLSLKSKGSSDERQRAPFTVSELTDDERNTLTELIARVREFRHAVLVRLGRVEEPPSPAAPNTEPVAPADEPAPSVEDTVRVTMARGTRTVARTDLGDAL
jgi:hypothetical protein